MGKVTQADRDAAATWFIGYAGRTLEAECMREGAADHWPLVQAFARHRISYSFPEGGMLSAVLDEAEFLCARLDDLDWSTGFDDFGNSYNGHVDPSHSRLKKYLTALAAEPRTNNHAELVEALRPFVAEFNDAGAAHLPDEMPWNEANNDDGADPVCALNINVGHFRAAAKALSLYGGEKP